MQDSQPLLQNGDIALTPLELSDATALFALVASNRGHLRRWLAWVDAQASAKDSEKAIARGRAQFEAGTGIVFGVRYRTELVGVAGFNEIDSANRTASVGYWLGGGYQGKGIMTAACRLLIDHGFNDRTLHRIEIRCATGNTKSRAIPERLGFAHEGTLREAEWLYDHFGDQELYAMLRQAWIA